MSPATKTRPRANQGAKTVYPPRAGAKTPPRAVDTPAPIEHSPSGVEIPERASQASSPIQDAPAPVETPPEGWPRNGTHLNLALGGVNLPPRAVTVSAPSIGTLAGVDSTGWIELRAVSEMHADALDALGTLNNRARTAGLDAALTAHIVEAQETVEHQLRLLMVRTFRRVAPEYRAWAATVPGVGESTLARILGCIGNPRIATPHHWEGEGKTRVLVADPPFERNVAKLWAYCGYGDPERRKRKGMTAGDAMALGNPRAKTLVYLVAEASLKGERHGAPYAVVYRDARAHYEANRPEWTPGHRHAAAMRKASKAFLLDLWRVS